MTPIEHLDARVSCMKITGTPSGVSRSQFHFTSVAIDTLKQ